MDWTLVEYRAQGSWGDTKAVVDTLDLRTGLSIETGTWQGSCIGALPAIAHTNNPASVETYIRGTDLVTTHPATSSRPTRVQLYWRRWLDVPPSVSAVVELIASVQTHMLDSDPRLVIESRLPKSAKSSHAGGITDIDYDNSQLLILTHPHDETEVEQREIDSSPTIQHTLFRNRLEKGVILRGRLLFVWSDQQVDAKAIRECTDRFYSSEPMLTA